jgi:hypothetical protein
MKEQCFGKVKNISISQSDEEAKEDGSSVDSKKYSKKSSLTSKKSSSTSKKSKYDPNLLPYMVGVNNSKSKIHTAFEEYPFGPHHLYSSSCLETWNSYRLAFCDHTAKLKIATIQNDASAANIEATLMDDHLGQYSNIYGVSKANLDDSIIIALKYMDGISVIDSSSKNVVSRLLTNESSSKNEDDVTAFADMTFLTCLDSLLAVDIFGNLYLHDYNVIILKYFLRVQIPNNVITKNHYM